MVPPLRAAVSGRDYQLRYALWRLTRMATARGDLRDEAAVRVEWPLHVGDASRRFVDVLVEDEAGEPLEVVECKEHLGFIEIDSVVEFLEHMNEIDVHGAVSPRTRFRFVTDAQIVRRARRNFNLVTEEARKALFAVLSPAHAAIARRLESRITWNAGHARKDHLTSDTLLELSNDLSREETWSLYLQSFVRLASQATYRHPEESDITTEAILDLHYYLFHRRNLAEALPPPDPNRFAASELRTRIAPGAAYARKLRKLATTKVEKQLRRTLDDLPLDVLYVEPDAVLRVPRGGGNRVESSTAESLLLKWIAEQRHAEENRRPLLVLGPFGSGKSVLLTAFASRLLTSDADVTPVLVPLRDLKTIATRQGLTQALEEHLRLHADVDLSDRPDDAQQVLLLLDGFDELNLYFASRKSTDWIDACFREIEALAERRNILVIVSSRPVLVLDVGRPGFAGEGCPRLEMKPFTADQIRRWCVNYLHATGSTFELSWEFLEERGLAAAAQTPLVLYMIASLLNENSPAFEEARSYSRGEVYRLFIERTIRGSYASDATKYRLPDAYASMLRDVAWMFFQSGEPFLSAATIVDRLRALYGESSGGVAVDRVILNAHMMQTVSTGIAEAKERDLLEFSHQSFQEYLVASRVWEILEPLRRGEPMTVAQWLALGDRPFGESEIGFLNDLVEAMSAAAARSLHDALSIAASISLDDETFRGAAEENARRTLSRDARRCGLAALAFLLRLACRNRLRRLHADDETVMVPAPAPFRALQTIIALHDAFDLDAMIAASKRTLLLNLRGINLTDARLPCQDWVNADLRHATLIRAGFQGSDLMDLVLDGANLHAALLERTQFRPASIRGASFRSTRFDGAMLLFIAEELTGADFTKACFDRARLVGLRFAECTFVNNSWSGAEIRLQSEKRSYLRDCVLDAEAEHFFRAGGVELIRCRRPA